MKTAIKELLQEVVILGYAPIYNYIGRSTKPLEVEQCECGDWWIRLYKPLPSYFKYIHGSPKFEYCYQGISQDRWGYGGKMTSI